MRRTLYVALAAGAALSGCRGGSDAAPAAPPGPALAVATVDYGSLSHEAQRVRDETIDHFVWETFPDLPDGIPVARLRKLGKLPMERVRHLPNEYVPGAKIEERTFELDGLVITGQVDEKQRFRIWYAKVTRPEWRVRADLRVGAGVEAVVRTLGPPNDVRGAAIDYQGESEAARFTIRDGRVAELELFHYHE